MRGALKLVELDGGFGFLHYGSEIIVVDVLFIIFVLIGGLTFELILRKDKVFMNVLVSIVFLCIGIDVL